MMLLRKLKTEKDGLVWLSEDEEMEALINRKKAALLQMTASS